MANFIPLKKYMFYCLDYFLSAYHLQPPFLDVGCGTGGLSKYLSFRGWGGKAIDVSDEALEIAQRELSDVAAVTVEKKSIFEENGRYKTVFLWDVVEHIKDDEAFLKQVSNLLEEGGCLILIAPSNPEEWRWDDVYYGHYRRYTQSEMEYKLKMAGLLPKEIIDCTYPVFWFMRRFYTKFKKPSGNIFQDKENRSRTSAVRNAWDISMISGFLNSSLFDPFWKIIYRWQFKNFRDKVDKGWEMFVLAKKE